MNRPTAITTIAVLEISGGALLFLGMLAVSVQACLMSTDPPVPAGVAIGAAFFLLPVLWALSGVFLLRGNRAWRWVNLPFQVLRIILVPIGTAWAGVAIYFLFFNGAGKEFFCKQ